MQPTSIDEAADLLAAATRDGRRVRIGAELRTEGLARVLEHEAGDLTCTVEAGIRLSALRDVLAQAGQRLSLDPPGDPTVGECLARRLSGPLSHRYGTPRDLVLGVTLVLGDPHFLDLEVARDVLVAALPGQRGAGLGGAGPRGSRFILRP